MTRRESKLGKNNPMFGKHSWNWKGDILRYPSGSPKYPKQRRISQTGLKSSDPKYQSVYYNLNKEDRVNYQKKYWTKEKRRTRTLRNYGLTIQSWEKMFYEQGFACAICKSKTSAKFGWATDHNHKTGKVRGILCSNCNTAIGQMKEDSKRLRLAADYIDKYNAI